MVDIIIYKKDDSANVGNICKSITDLKQGFYFNTINVKNNEN